MKFKEVRLWILMAMIVSTASGYDFLEKVLKLEKCGLEEKSTSVSKDGCDDATVKIKYCAGRCISMSVFKHEYPYFTSRCRCCKAMEMTTRFARLLCGSKTMEIVPYEEAIKCECKKCSNGATKFK